MHSEHGSWIRSSPRFEEFLQIRTARTFVLVALWAATPCCETQRDVVAIGAIQGGASGQTSVPPVEAGSSSGHSSGGVAGSTAGGGVSAGGGESAGSAGREQDPECFPRVPLTPLGGGPRSACSATLARDRMSHALCACENLEILGFLSTEGFDSNVPADATTAGASVGVNGQYVHDTYANIDGSFTVASPLALAFDGLDVTGDLRLAGAISSTGPVRIGRDAWLLGAVSVVTWLQTGRDMHVLPSAEVDGVTLVGGRSIAEPFTFDPPCRCGPDPEFDLQAAVLDAQSSNDNSVAELGTAMLGEPATPVELNLPCGRFFLTEIRSERSIRIRVTGRAALFVAGDVLPTGELTIELAEEGELDWFIQGDLDLSMAERVGDPARAAKVRIYVAGTQEIPLPPAKVAANVHAPRADVALTDIDDFYGSILAKSIRGAGALGVRYDRAVFEVDPRCAEPPLTACSGCGACSGGLTCIAGSCQNCATDDDCCEPFVCNAGVCEPLLSSGVEE